MRFGSSGTSAGRRGWPGRSGAAPDLGRASRSRLRGHDARPHHVVTGWSPADLERRLCRALDLAAQVVADFGDKGYTDTLDARLSFGPEKVVAEAAMLAYAAAGIVGRPHVRERVDDLARRLVPYVR